VQQIIAVDIRDGEVQPLGLHELALGLFREAFGVQRTAVDDDFDAFLGYQLDGLAETIPGCWDPAFVLTGGVGFGVVA